jgi:hypothetical protein
MAETQDKANDVDETGNVSNQPAATFSIIGSNTEPESEPVKTGKRGRPKGSKNSNRNIEIPGKAQSNTVTIPNAQQIESAKFLGMGLVSLVELAETFVHGSCEKKIAKAYPDKLSEFREMAAKLALQPKDAEILQSSMQQIALQHSWLTNYAPEVMLSITLTQYSLRQLHLVKFVNNVVKDIPPMTTSPTSTNIGKA